MNVGNGRRIAIVALLSIAVFGGPVTLRAQERQLPGKGNPQGGATQRNFVRMKMIKAIDQSGFERPIPSASMLIPTDWQSESGTAWYAKDLCNGIQTHMHTTGPDGRGVDIFPAFNWVWADDPKFLQMSAAQSAQMGNRPCSVMPPMKAADFLRRNLSRYRANAQVVGVEAAPKLMQLLQERAQQIERQAAQFNLKQRVQVDAVKVRVRYTVNGKAVEEWLVVSTVITGTLGPTYNVANNRPGQAFTYNCVAYVTGERAPQGQLDATESLFDLITGTFRWDQAWQARINGHNQAMGAIARKGVSDRSAIITKNNEEISNIRRQTYEHSQRVGDQISEQRSQTMRGVETYRNPSTGDTIELSNQYGRAWTNNRGEYLLSDQPGFDPSVVLKEEWKALERVKP